MVLPNFMIGGERRCGTTSLYYWMQCHPEVYLYPQSDTAFFVDDDLLSLKSLKINPEHWEDSHSIDEYAKRFESERSHKAVGEKCAEILFWPRFQERLFRYVPDCKLIIMLRNPVNRAWSDYCMITGKGREELNFKKALSVEDERTRKWDYTRWNFSYRKRGYYDESLEVLYQVFPPAQVKVIIFEQMVKQPVEGLKSIYEFLNINPELGLDNAGKRFNENLTQIKREWVDQFGFDRIDSIYHKMVRKLSNKIFKKYIEPGERRLRQAKMEQYAQIIFRRSAAGVIIPQRIKNMLEEDYAPHIQKLEHMLGRKINEWSQERS